MENTSGEDEMIVDSIIDDLERTYGDLLETGRNKEASKVNEVILMLLEKEPKDDQ